MLLFFVKLITKLSCLILLLNINFVYFQTNKNIHYFCIIKEYIASIYGIQIAINNDSSLIIYVNLIFYR